MNIDYFYLVILFLSYVCIESIDRTSIFVLLHVCKPTYLHVGGVGKHLL